MEDIIREFKFQISIYFKDKMQLFWSSIFPIILITFFYFAFYNLANDNVDFTSNIKPKILVEDKNISTQVLESTEEFTLVYVKDKEEGLDKIVNDEYIGYVDNENKIYIKKNGLSESLLKEVVGQVEEIKVIVNHDNNANMDLIRRNNVDFKDAKGNGYKVMYYSLISYILTFGMFNSLKLSIRSQANLSGLGARITISPRRKSTYIIAGLLATFVVSITSNIIAYFYIEYILKLNLISDIKHSLMIVIAGNLLGIAFGLFVGVSSNLTYNEKNTITIIVPLLLSFLGGMQGPEVLNLIDKKIPFINYINPQTIMTKMLYQVNILGIDSNFYSLLFRIIVISLILLLFSILFLRRKKYDSI